MKYIAIENQPDRARKLDSFGVDYVFIDLEIIGKIERQGHLNTVISEHHQLSDINLVKEQLINSKLLVRCNPIHANSENEINEIINRGADVIMLPFFKNHFEVERFLSIVNGRIKTILLLETVESFCRVDRILEVSGIDEIHIGLNDLHLGMGLNFMFELISTGIVDILVNKLKYHGINFGIGGIASLEGGLISGADVMKEHVRLGSSMVILSRSLTNSFTENIDGLEIELLKLRNFEITLNAQPSSYFVDEHAKFKFKINQIVDKKMNI